MTTDRPWHPYQRVERAIRELMATKWNDQNRATAKTALSLALAAREKIQRAGWFN